MQYKNLLLLEKLQKLMASTDFVHRSAYDPDKTQTIREGLQIAIETLQSSITCTTFPSNKELRQHLCKARNSAASVLKQRKTTDSHPDKTQEPDSETVTQNHDALAAATGNRHSS